MIVTGDTRPLKELLQQLGGDERVQFGGAVWWVFTGSQKDALLAALRAELAEGESVIKCPSPLNVSMRP